MKPHLTYSSGGNGYWICRTIRNGAVYQGVGATPREAYDAWIEITRGVL